MSRTESPGCRWGKNAPAGPSYLDFGWTWTIDVVPHPTTSHRSGWKHQSSPSVGATEGRRVAKGATLIDRRDLKTSG